VKHEPQVWALRHAVGERGSRALPQKREFDPRIWRQWHRFHLQKLLLADDKRDAFIDDHSGWFAGDVENPRQPGFAEP